jgi:NDP-sugar pyrophosphorylase family protein
MNKLKAFFPAAGVSRRFGYKIKQLAVVDKSGHRLLDYCINYAQKAGINSFIFVLGDATKTEIEKYLAEHYPNLDVQFAYQEIPEGRTKPLGTTDVTVCAYRQLNIKEPIIWLNSDDLYGWKNIASVKSAFEGNPDYCYTLGMPLDLLLPTDPTVSANRGIWLTDKEGNATQIKEYLNISRDTLTENGLKLNNICNINLHAFTPDCMRFLSENEEVDMQKGVAPDSELLLTDDLNRLLVDKKVQFKVLQPTESKYLGITYPGDELKAQEKLEGGYFAD